MESSITVGGRKDFCAGFESALYCLQDTDGDSVFDRVKIVGGARALPRVSGRYALEYQPRQDLPGWRKELIYQGASERVARFSFREYGSDWSTPKASQDLSYDLSAEGTTEVVYQGAKLEILSATSNGLRYKVITGFRPPGVERNRAPAAL